MTTTILSAFTHVTSAGDGWMARCPAHEDKTPSLSIGKGDDGRWLLKCHAGCGLDSVLREANLERRDLFPQNGSGATATTRRIVETYDYATVGGDLLFQVVRYEPKDFRQRRPDG